MLLYVLSTTNRTARLSLFRSGMNGTGAMLLNGGVLVGREIFPRDRRAFDGEELRFLPRARPMSWNRIHM